MEINLIKLASVIAAWSAASLGEAAEDSAVAWIDIKQLFYSLFLNSYNISCFIDHSHGKWCHLTAIFGKMVQNGSLHFDWRCLSAISTAGVFHINIWEERSCEPCLFFTAGYELGFLLN